MHATSKAAVIAERHTRYQREAAESRLARASLNSRPSRRNLIDSLVAELIAKVAYVAVSAAGRIGRPTTSGADARAR